jgi:hypothetical protein
MKNFYSLLAVLFISIISYAQLPVLPLDFESATINYAFTDFDGGATTKITNTQSNGINTSANVAKMIKNAGNVWGGSWIQLATPIDFSVNKTFKVKVYSPRAGAKLLLKVENASNAGINFEKEATCTVANAWQELTFDYSTINTANSYQKLIFIFDNGTMGDGTANFTWLFDDVRLTTSGGGGGLTQMNVPVTFDDATVDYGLVGFGGAEQATIVVDPTLATNKVAKVIKTNTAELWAGVSVTALNGTTQTAFANNIPFAVGATKMNVRVWSPHAGIPVRLKVEDKTDPTKSCETEATVTVASGWQTLEFNFANQAAGTAALNFTFNYNKVSIFFNFGTTGAIAGERIYYFDDVKFGAASSGGGLTQMNVPVTFDDATVDYGLVGFGGAEQSTIITDPTLATNKVAKVIKNNTAELWAGTTLSALLGTIQTSFANAIPFTATERRMNVRVWSPHTNIKVRLKVEDKTDPTKSCETEATFTGAANTWQTLEFNFNNQATGTAPFNQAFTFNKASIFFNFGVTGATAGERIYYFDDVKFGPISTAPSLPVLPLDFESATINYTFTDFDGGATTKIANTQINGINTSANVAKMVKSAGQPWGGSWIQLASPIDFSVNKIFKVKVFSPRVGAKLLLKVENATDGNINFEKEVTSTVANAWEELTFDYTTINIANQYSKLIFIFDLGSVGNGSANFTWLFDDVRLIAAPVLTQMNLPVTFDLATVNYGLVGFGGAEQSTIVTDPTLATNKVAKVIKTNTAELWAGTTITALNGTTQTGFATNMPFTNCATKISVRVWSPHSGIKVRLKVEDKTDGTKSCETEATVTVASGWQTLEFNFANQVTGTAPLNLAFNYNKASIFFNFGVTGSAAGERIYYFDDVNFINVVAPTAPTVTTPITYCQSSTATALTATITTGNTAKWYTTATGGTALASAPIPSTAATGTTTYYVSQASSTTCESVRTAIIVNVNTTPIAPTVTTPIGYCQNATTQALTATALAGNTLNWYTVATGGTASTLTPLPTATVVGTTNYYVTQSTGVGCESPRALIAVIVNALPSVPQLTAAPYTQLFPGLTTTITANNTTTGNTYIWYKNGLAQTGQATNAITVNINQLGNYSVKVTNANGCGIVSSSLPITGASNDKLFIYPNASTGKFQVRYFSDVNNLRPRQLVIYSSEGSLVYTSKFAMFDAYTPIYIDLSSKQSGLYTVYLLDFEGKKLISERVMISK